jgi:DegV family protein with EDD domain
MPADELKALDITEAPLYIQFPEGEVSSADISADEFYRRMENMFPALPTTAQPSSGLFTQLYERLLAIDSHVLSIHISSGLSGTVNSAANGKEKLSSPENVTVWDTLTLSGGERFQVMAAALATRAGWAWKTIQKRLEEIRESTEVVYTLDTLEYLARGGRIGRVQALAGALLHIKPIIRVEHKDGKYSTVTQTRTIPKALSAITDHLQKMYTNKPVWVNVLHGNFAEKADDLAKQLSEKLNIAKMEKMRISPVLGVHTGPLIVGAAVVPMELMKDLL